MVTCAPRATAAGCSIRTTLPPGQSPACRHAARPVGGAEAKCPAIPARFPTADWVVVGTACKPLAHCGLGQAVESLWRWPGPPCGGQGSSRKEVSLWPQGEASGELSSAVTSGKAPSSPGRPSHPGQTGTTASPCWEGHSPQLLQWPLGPLHVARLLPAPGCSGECLPTLWTSHRAPLASASSHSPLNHSSRAPAAAQLPGLLAQPGPPQTLPTAVQAELGQPARAPSSCTCPSPQTVRQGHVQNPAQACPLQATGEHF